MRYILVILVSGIIVAGCPSRKVVSNNSKPQVAKVEDTAKLAGVEEFLGRFETAVLTHNRSTMMDLMDRDYKVEQHDKFLKGNTEQFLNEFFCGYRTDGQGHKCPKFSDITAVKRVELLPNEGNYTATYHISVKEITVNVSWLIMVKGRGSKATYGFYGSQG